MSDRLDSQPARRDDAPPALICVDEGDRHTAVHAALEELGYAPDTVDGAADAADKLRKVAYDVVVVDDSYDGATGPDNAVLKALHAMGMSTRRYIFVALLAEDVKTLDNGTAFSRSVNAVINVNDVGQLAGLLRRAIVDNDAFYRVFREVLQAAGKR